MQDALIGYKGRDGVVDRILLWSITSYTERNIGLPMFNIAVGEIVVIFSLM